MSIDFHHLFKIFHYMFKIFQRLSKNFHRLSGNFHRLKILFVYFKIYFYFLFINSIYYYYKVITMARAEHRLRDYDKADDKMLEQSQTLRNLFEADKADFIAFYNHLSDPFSANFQSDIDLAHALPTSDEEIAELEVKTEDVEALMETARVQYQKFASYVRLLFPASKARQGIFGLDKYVDDRKSKSRMYDLIRLAQRKADSADYKGDLIALGFVQAEIDNLGAIAEGLYDAKEAQEEIKQNIKVLTEERVAAYNKVWRSLAAVAAASKQVFPDNFAKQRQYMLYPEGRGGAAGA